MAKPVKIHAHIFFVVLDAYVLVMMREFEERGVMLQTCIDGVWMSLCVSRAPTVLR